MPEEYFSQSGKQYFTKDNSTRSSSGKTLSHTDELNFDLKKHREIKTRRVVRKYAASKN